MHVIIVLKNEYNDASLFKGIVPSTLVMEQLYSTPLLPSDGIAITISSFFIGRETPFVQNIFAEQYVYP